MKKQLITESELRDRISSLREKMVVAEDAASIGQAAGQLAGGAAGIATAVPRLRASPKM